MHTIFTIFMTALFMLSCTIVVAQVPAKFVKNSKKSKRHNQKIKKGLIQSDFDLVGGLIFVNAEIDGATEKFIFDTGAPHLFLNTKNRNFINTNHQIVGVNGEQNLEVKKDVKLNWQGQTLKDKKAYGLDLSHIEKTKGKEIGGLLGYDMVKGKELVIDYQTQKIYLISKKNKSFFSGHEKVDKVFFRMVGHIPVVRVRFGKKNFYFGIDTGAEVNVIDEKLKGTIPEELIGAITQTKVMGVNEGKHKADFITIKSTQVGKTKYDEMQYVFADLSSFHNDSEFKIHGFLGYSFLKQANFSINYRKGQLIKWQPKSTDKDLKLVRKEAVTAATEN